ncbi:RNA 2',3'-cyclic phosphodiesterase [Bacteroidota bacterium]
MTNRLFVALDIPAEVREFIIGIRDEIYGFDPNIRWEGIEKLHLTLKFLGDVEESGNVAIIDSLKSISEKFSGIQLSLFRFGLFYRDNKPNILWIGLNENESLFNLVSDIETNFEKLGFRKEKRRFKPHITLLRLKGFEDLSKIKNFCEYKLDYAEFISDRISLIKSKLTSQGSIYTQLQSFKMN